MRTKKFFIPAKRKNQHSEDNNNKAEELVHSQKETHGKSFTSMQYRICAEMVAGGLHEDIDHLTNTSTFCRAGNTETKKKSAEGTLAEALTVVADKISSTVSPFAITPNHNSASSNRASPAKVIH